MMIHPVLAPPPFDNPAADVILRSSDMEPTDFRAFKLLLSLSSPFFSEIFTLPQPANPDTSVYSDEYVEDPNTPVIQMTEDKQTLQLLLGLCLPISMYAPPRFSSLQEIQMVQDAASKFEMEGVQKYLRKELVSPRFIESQPLRAFTIAYRYGWDAEARKAARYTLRHPINTAFVSELEFISGATFFRLQEYYRMCGEVASSRALLQPALAEQHDIWTWITCKRCPAAWNASSPDYANYPPARKWWTQWIEDIAKELRIKPWGETVRKWDLLRKAQAQAAGCPNCGKRSTEDLEAFSQMLAVEIERDISMVDLDLNLDDWSSASTTE
ncbi:hypothetical protein BDN70DRAFT_834210 [Pholiota conissans]|uniref:BTB domain-containing protein n=1 Tax=Pholiota conissans TaxID=109636 RepID=A0A9P6CUG2_9AGAR|nr:hypothetical protein BDN70DRAFT_834210 [Pholiota conissans]